MSFKFQTLQMRPAHGLGLLARTLVRGNRQVDMVMMRNVSKILIMMSILRMRTRLNILKYEVENG